jgi:hypothetical protein
MKHIRNQINTIEKENILGWELSIKQIYNKLTVTLNQNCTVGKAGQ